jgi:hypothetical protein
MGTKTTHVPYRGNAPAMQDLIAGRLDFMCDSIVAALPQIQGNAAHEGFHQTCTSARDETNNDRGVDHP